MKKSYLMIAAFAALLASCSDNDTFKEAVSGDDAQQPLTFSAYAGKNTKAKGENSALVQDFYDTFSVWGFKKVTRTANNTDVDKYEDVFDNDPVEYFSSDEAGDPVYVGSKPSTEWVKQGQTFSAGWYYENVRFWDKLAKSYEFFAVAPYVAKTQGEYAVEAGDDNIKIKSSSTPYVISAEKNLAIENDIPKSQTLSYCGFDRDYMVAQKITKPIVSNSTIAEPVVLEFKHILAKLNVKIKLGNSFIGDQELIVNELKIAGLAEKGYYEGQTDLTGWTITADRYPRDIKKDYSLTDENTNYSEYYWLETLMFPQEATCKVVGVKPTATGMTDMYLYINYHIGSENYEAYYDFASIWLDNAQVDDKFNFVQGNEYNLTITVGPEPIEFEANVAAWAPVNQSI